MKNATYKINNGNIPYIVSAFIGEIGLSIDQVKVDDKSNEITTIPDLLDLLDIDSATITIDAIGTQYEIADKIVSKGGHYALKVKKNQSKLLRNIKSQFNSYNNLYGNDNVQYKKTIDKDHDREKIREYFLIYDTNKIKDKIKWKTVKSSLYVKVQREEKDELKVTDNYYIIDYKIDIVNDCLHNELDNQVFRLMKKIAIENNISIKNARNYPEVNKLLIKNRKKMNTSDGYYIVSIDDAACDYAYISEFDKNNIETIFICSDGFEFNILDINLNDFINLVTNENLINYRNEIIHKLSKDKDWNIYSERFKDLDDIISYVAYKKKILEND